MRDYASLYSRLLEDLQLEAVTDYSPIFSDLTPVYAAKLSLASSFFKKLAPMGSSKVAEQNALKKFLAINSDLPQGPWSLLLENEAESCFYDYFRDNLRVALEPRDDDLFDLEFIRDNMGIGPGAAQKADSRCMYTKLFESSISYTNEYLIALYRSALVETGLWCEAERLRFMKFGFTKVSGGKLFFAPKNAEISRTCNTEPNLNMLVQKAVGAFLEVRLRKHFGISLETQPDLNRELARRGSIDGSFGTIDLVSASDSMGLYMIQRDLPDGALKGAIMNSRCERAVLSNGSSVKLNMVSTMGNGFTFPLQTLVFACAVRAVYQVMGFPCTDPGAHFGVFGDDICVRRETYQFLCRMLTKLGFQVNDDKSYNTGPFRESCGNDYYLGYNIRGVYVRSLETPQQVCSLINRLHRWSATHMVMLPKTLALLKTWMGKQLLLVPPSEADDAGIHVPFELTKPKLDSRYWFKYRYYKKRVRKMELVENETGSDRDFNNPGLAVTFLAGHTRRRDIVFETENSSIWAKSSDWTLRIPIRDRIGARSRYTVASSSLPWWDWVRLPKKPNSRTLWEEDESLRQPLAGLSYDAWRGVVTATLGDS